MKRLTLDLHFPFPQNNGLGLISCGHQGFIFGHCRLKRFVRSFEFRESLATLIGQHRGFNLRAQIADFLAAILYPFLHVLYARGIICNCHLQQICPHALERICHYAQLLQWHSHLLVEYSVGAI